MKKFTCILVLISFTATIFTYNLAMACYQQSDRYSLAVMNLAVKGGDISRTEARLLSGQLTQELENGGLFFTMAQPDMERGLMLKNLNLSGCETIDCGMRAGRALGVQLISIGTLNQSGPIISIKLQMIHLASREIVKSLNEVFEGDVNGLMEYMPVLANKFVGQQISDSPLRTEKPVSSRAEFTINRKSSIKWYLVGIGLLVAGGIGAGVYLSQKDSGSNGGTTTTPATNLSKPPNFP